jgi:hypothetical protein
MPVVRVAGAGHVWAATPASGSTHKAIVAVNVLNEVGL